MSRTPLEMYVDAHLAAEKADRASVEEGVEDALLAAEAAARSGGEAELAEVLARVHMLWTVGGIRYARALLDRARDSVLEALRDDPVDTGKEEA